MARYETSNLILPLVSVQTYDTCISPYSIFEYQENEEIPEGQEEKDFDFKKFCKDMGEYAAQIVEKNAKTFIVGHESGIKAIKSDGTVHNPRHYNLWNGGGMDYLDITIDTYANFKTVARRNFKKWMEEDADGKGRVAEYVRENYSSYDGFRSFIPNTLQGILDQLLNNEDMDRTIGVYATLVAVDNHYFDSEDPYDNETPADRANLDLYEDMISNMDYFTYATLGPVEAEECGDAEE